MFQLQALYFVCWPIACWQNVMIFLHESTPRTKSMDWLYCFLFQYVRRLFQNNDLRLLVFLTNRTIRPKQNVCNMSIFLGKTTFCLKCNGHLILVGITYACWLTRHCTNKYSVKVRPALVTELLLHKKYLYNRVVIYTATHYDNEPRGNQFALIWLPIQAHTLSCLTSSVNLLR